VDCAALEKQIDSLYAQIALNPPNARQLEHQLDQIESIWARFCFNPPPPPPPEPTPAPIPCPIKIHLKTPQHGNNNTITPPNMWPYVPPSIIIIFMIPWPGNPVYAGL